MWLMPQLPELSRPLRNTAKSWFPVLHTLCFLAGLLHGAFWSLPLVAGVNLLLPLQAGLGFSKIQEPFRWHQRVQPSVRTVLLCQGVPRPSLVFSPPLPTT